MTVTCPDCRSVFRVDPAKVPSTGVRARCSVCGGVIAIAAGTLPVSVTPGSSGAVGHGYGATPGNGGNASNRSTPAGSAMGSIAPLAPIAPALMTPPVPAGIPVGSRVAPLRTPVPTPAPTRSPGFTPAMATASMTTVIATPSTPPAAPPSASPARRPINPFLNADPGQRARRLARALVSDLVAYHPQKRDEGLREGTLRQLFRDEIKKSYEEYVEQVGRELADGSPHFQDALNDILGGGRKLF